MHDYCHAISPASSRCDACRLCFYPCSASGTSTHSAGNRCLCAQGVEHNSEAALYAVSQGRGRSAGCANLTAAETIAAQRCLRKPACSKALGHAGFCDNGKSASAMRHNSLAGLAAAAEQASNGSPGSIIDNQHWHPVSLSQNHEKEQVLTRMRGAGYGAGQVRPEVRTLAADRSPSSQQPQVSVSLDFHQATSRRLLAANPSVVSLLAPFF